MTSASIGPDSYDLCPIVTRKRTPVILSMIHNEIFNEMVWVLVFLALKQFARFLFTDFNILHAVEGFETKRHTANLTPTPWARYITFCDIFGVLFVGFSFFAVLHHPCIILDQHPQSVNEVDDYLSTFGDSAMDFGRKTN